MKIVTLLTVLIIIQCASGACSQNNDQGSTIDQDTVIGLEQLVDLTTIYHPEDGRSVRSTFASVRFLGHGGMFSVQLPNRLKFDGSKGVLLSSVDGLAFADIGARRGRSVSPDDSWIAFYDKNGGFIIGAWNNSAIAEEFPIFDKADTGALFDHKSNSYMGEGIAWSQDSTRVAFLTAPEPANGVAVGSSNYNVDPLKSAIFVYDLTKKELTSAYVSEGDIAEVAWVPGQDKIVFSERNLLRDGPVGVVNASFLFDIISLDVESGQRITLAENVSAIGGFIRLSTSPDGSKVAFYGEPYPLPPSFLGLEPQMIDLTTGALEPIGDRSFMPPYPGEAIKWSPDARKLYYRCKKGALFSFLCVTDLKTETTEYVDLGQTEDTLALDVNFEQGTLMRISQDAYDVVRLKTSDLDGADERVLFESSRIDLNGVSLGGIQAVRWKSFDGLELGGLLVLPIDYKAGRKYPLIVDVHGGPFGGARLNGSLGNASPLEWQIWAARGYAVFVADYRKGAAYGAREEYLRRPANGSDIDMNANDILAGVDHIIEMGIADPDRLAIIGHSFGSGYTNWILTKTDRFKAAISKEGWADMRPRRDVIASSPQSLWGLRATEDTLDEILAGESAILKADRVRTPVLIFSAENGFGRPANDTSEEFADAINAAGGTAVRIHYEDDYHNFTKPKNIRRTFVESVEWIERYLSE